MAPNLALAFALSGIALWLLNTRSTHRIGRIIARFCYFIVFLIGAITLSEYIFGWTSTIDTALLQVLDPEIHEMFPGRPAFNAALGLVFSAVTLLMLDTAASSRWIAFSQMIASMLGYLAFIAFIGYFFALSTYDPVYGTRTHSGGDMAFHAALAFFLIFVSTLTARPGHGLMELLTSKDLSGVAARHILVAVLFGPLLLAPFVAFGNRLGILSVAESYSLVTAVSVLLFGAWSFWTGHVLRQLERERRAFDRERDGLYMIEKSARIEAEIAVKMRDELVALVSHDLKNPLSAIRMNAEMLLMPHPEGGHPPARHSQAILQQVDRMDRLISDILTTTKIQSGVFTIAQDRRPSDLKPVLERAISAQETLAEAKALRVKLVVPDRLPKVSIDEMAVSRALQNLLSNSIKFTPPGGEIHVTAERQGDFVAISVADTGPGIAPETLAHIFDRLYMARMSRSAGTGLGLYITKGIVEAHGGKIEVWSEPGRGTCFTITFPISTEKQLAA